MSSEIAIDHFITYSPVIQLPKKEENVKSKIYLDKLLILLVTLFYETT